MQYISYSAEGHLAQFAAYTFLYVLCTVTSPTSYDFMTEPHYFPSTAARDRVSLLLHGERLHAPPACGSWHTGAGKSDKRLQHVHVHVACLACTLRSERGKVRIQISEL